MLLAPLLCDQQPKEGRSPATRRGRSATKAASPAKGTPKKRIPGRSPKRLTLQKANGSPRNGTLNKSPKKNLANAFDETVVATPSENQAPTTPSPIPSAERDRTPTPTPKRARTDRAKAPKPPASVAHGAEPLQMFG